MLSYDNLIVNKVINYKEKNQRENFEPSDFRANKTKTDPNRVDLCDMLTRWDDFGSFDPLVSYPNFDLSFKQTRELLQG